LPDTYHSAGHGQGTATLKFYEGRDILQLVVIGTLAPCVLWPQPPGPVKSPSPRVRSLR